MIVVALFATLSYAVTKSGRGGGSLDREKDYLTASLFLQKIAELRTAYDRFALQLGAPARVLISVSANNWTPCSSGANCFWADEGGGYSTTAFQEYIWSMGFCEEAWCAIGAFHDQFNHPYNITSSSAPDNAIGIYYLKISVCEQIKRIQGQPTDLTVAYTQDLDIRASISNCACAMSVVLTAF